VDPNQVLGLKMNFLSMLVSLELGLFDELLNPFPNLYMKILNLFGPLLSLPTKNIVGLGIGTRSNGVLGLLLYTT